MINLQINLTGQHLVVTDPPILAAGSRGKVFFNISADAPWEGLSLSVTFRRIQDYSVITRHVILQSHTSIEEVPPEVIANEGWLYIGVVGYGSAGDEILTTRVMEDPIKIYPSESQSEEIAGSVTPSVAEQLLAQIGSLQDTVDAIKICYTRTVAGRSGDIVLTGDDITIAFESSSVSLTEALLQAYQKPILRGQFDGDNSYLCTSSRAPSVMAGSSGTHVGKGAQVLFVPSSTNPSAGPALSLRRSSDEDYALPIEIRQRAPDAIEDVTTEVPAGMLLGGVPYQLTFCGKFWLVDNLPSGLPSTLRTLDIVLQGLSEGDVDGFPAVFRSGELGMVFLRRSPDGVSEETPEVPTMEYLPEYLDARTLEKESLFEQLDPVLGYSDAAQLKAAFSEFDKRAGNDPE